MGEFAGPSTGKNDQESYNRALAKMLSAFGVSKDSEIKASQNSGGADRSVDISVGDILIPYLDYHIPGWVTAKKNVALAVNTSGLTRISTIVAYMDLSVNDTTNANAPGKLKIVEVAGTPSGSPVAPNDSAIQSAIGAGNPFRRICSIPLAHNYTQVTDDMITDLRDRTKIKRSVIQYIESFFMQAIINGGMQVNQRQITPSLSTSYQFSIDRMAVKAAGSVSAGTISQITNSSLGNSGYALKVAGVTLTGSGEIYLRYRMESKDAVKLKNKSISVGAKVIHDIGTSKNYVITVRKPTVTDDFTSVTDINVSNNIPVQSSVATQIKSENVSLGDCSKGLEIEIKCITGSITTKNLEFTELQLNEGSELLDFMPRMFSDELLRCTSYYEKSFDYDTTPARNLGTNTGELYFFGSSQASGLVPFTIKYKTRKVKVPTIKFYTRIGAVDDQWDYERSGASGNAAPSVIANGRDQFTLAVNVGANWVGAGLEGHFTAEAEL